jgi:glutamate synthase domain-containing protein 3
MAVATRDGAQSGRRAQHRGRPECPGHIDVQGHAGYYAAGMNKHATVTDHGSAGTGVAENMMSGTVHVKGFASNGAGASRMAACW